MAITRTSFSLGDIPSTAEWNTQFDTAYNQINAWIDGTDAIKATQLDVNTIVTLATNGDLTITPDGTGQIVFSNEVQFDTASGLTAGTTQTQAGGLALTADINEFSTVANSGDTGVLPPAVAGKRCTTINNGANLMRIYPASGDNLGNGVDTYGELGDGDMVTLVCYDATNWVIEDGSITRAISMGDWNMDSTAAITTSHGLTNSKISSINGYVISDDSVTKYPSGAADASMANGWFVVSSNATVITTQRVTGGIFDNSAFDATSFSRGKLLLNYVL